MDLSKGGLEITPIIPSGTSTASNTFSPEVAIYDEYWGLGSQVFDSGSPNFIGLFGPSLYVSSPLHPVNPFGAAQLLLIAPEHSFYTNVVSTPLTITNRTGLPQVVLVPTNIVRQAAFVGGPDLSPTALDPGFTVSFRFFDSTDLLNPMQTVTVSVTNNATNVITGQPMLTTLYIKDTLASEPPAVLAVNQQTGTSRPSSYEISRLAPIEYLQGTDGQSGLTNPFFYNTNLLSRIVTNGYAAYGAFVDNIASQPVTPWAGITNKPGRIEIRADSINMSQTRMRGEGLTMIEAKHLVTSSNAIVDCQNLSYVLGSTNGNLNFQSLAKARVGRVNGELFTYSAVWTNYERFILTNFINIVTNPVQFELLTNIARVQNHIFMVDRSVLSSTVPVNVYNLRLNSANMIFSDQATIVNSMLFNGDSFTLNGALSLTNSHMTNTLTTFSAVNAPTLKYFTNNGTFLIANLATFGADTAQPYKTFVNNGVLTAFSQQVAADAYENYGTLSTVGTIGVRTFSGKLEGGSSVCAGDTEFWANTLSFNQYSLSTIGSLNFNVTNALFDNGPASGNVLNLAGGCSLAIKPTTGDLLGTTIDSTAMMFLDANHYWAAEDRGATAAGFQNNVAIGRLILHTAPLGTIVFHPVGGNNAIYVDELDLSFLSDYQNQIVINPGIVVYFASSVGVPEATLDGQFGGQLRWVSSFVGAKSGVDVVVNGNQTIRVNRALRNSQTIDSDVDGIPNYWDLTPFDGIVISKVKLQTAPNGLSLSWLGAAGVAYKVEYTSYSGAPSWQTLGSVTNASGTTNTMTFVDTNMPAAGAHRYYRVSYQP